MMAVRSKYGKISASHHGIASFTMMDLPARFTGLWWGVLRPNGIFCVNSTLKSKVSKKECMRIGGSWSQPGHGHEHPESVGWNSQLLPSDLLPEAKVPMTVIVVFLKKWGCIWKWSGRQRPWQIDWALFAGPAVGSYCSAPWLRCNPPDTNF